jgi:hypothetical protein
MSLELFVIWMMVFLREFIFLILMACDRIVLLTLLTSLFASFKKRIKSCSNCKYNEYSWVISAEQG